MTAKDVAKQVIEQLPDEVTLDDIIHELYVRQKIEACLGALEQGQVLSHEDVKRRVLNG